MILVTLTLDDPTSHARNSRDEVDFIFREVRITCCCSIGRTTKLKVYNYFNK